MLKPYRPTVFSAAIKKILKMQTLNATKIKIRILVAKAEGGCYVTSLGAVTANMFRKHDLYFWFISACTEEMLPDYS